MNTKIYIFGYGSLMNPKSLALTLPGTRTVEQSTLHGYERICNVEVNGYAYLNIRQSPGKAVTGVLIAVTADELTMLDLREREYARSDVSNVCASKNKKIYAYVALNTTDTLKVPRSYLLTCLAGVKENLKGAWTKETVIPSGIAEDLENPVYTNAVL